MTEPSEDIPYEVEDFATPDEEDTSPDPDQANKPVLLKVQKYLAEAIEEHNSFDIIDLTEQAKMNPTQQVAMHKCVVQHLRSIKNEVDSKLKELK